jgi:hypothetical protein
MAAVAWLPIVAPSAGATDSRAAGTPAVVSFEGFSDVPGGLYYSWPVNWAGWRGITNGIGTTGTFGVDRTITRAEVITWLFRLSGDDTPYPTSGFTDVGSTWYTTAVNWAKATGVTTGYGGPTTFAPTVPVTRAQMVTFLWRAAGEDRTAPPSGLIDVPVGNFAYAAVNWAKLRGITTGYGGSIRFEPALSASRAQAVTLVFRDETADAYDPGVDDQVRLNEIQTLGTHNSYRYRPARALFDILMGAREVVKASGVDPYELDYAARPLAEQFTRLGARQIELDVFADPAGGLYADRAFNHLTNNAVPVASGIAALNAPGYKVLHIQDLDYNSHCWTFVSCLEQVRDWSLANPSHLPLMILVEVKDEPLPLPDAALALLGGRTPATPPVVDATLLDDLDAEIRSVFTNPSQVLTPDAVRADAATLREAVTTTGWPTLAASRGKVLFALDNGARVRDEYVRDRPSLQGRMMFADVGSASLPGAAFFKLNNAADPAIAQRVTDGFIVRTRADGPYTSLLPVAAPSGRTSWRQALASGAQWVSSDYLERTDSANTEVRTSPYSAFFPIGGVARCNPVNRPAACKDDALTIDLFLLNRP